MLTMGPRALSRTLFERLADSARRSAPISEVSQVRRPEATKKPNELPSRRLGD